MCLFLRNVLIFEFLTETIGFCGPEDFFFVEKRDFVDVKTFFSLVFTEVQWFHKEF